MILRFPYIYQLLDFYKMLIKKQIDKNQHFRTYLKKAYLILLLLATISYSNKIAAQVTLFADTIEAQNGQVVNVPINVAGFNDIFSMQFSLQWDTTVLELKEVDSFSEELPQFGKDGIGLGESSSGKLIVVWFDNSLRGISLNDSTSIFNIQFEVVGKEGDRSSVMFSDTPAVVEIVDATSSVIETTLINGEVNIPSLLMTTSTYLQALNGMRLFQNHPNPFINNTTINASFNSAQWVTFVVTDAMGRSVYTEQFQSRIGPHSILLTKEQLPSAGLYTYTLQSENYKLSKQMILLSN